MLPDTTLALALLAVFALDRIQWLRHGEAVLELAAGEPRALAFGSSLELARHRPWLAGLWPPDRVGFRLSWVPGPDPRTAEAIAALRPRSAALRLPGWLCAASQLLVAGVAPLALVGGSSNAFIAAVAATALLTLATGLIAWRRRERLGLTALAIAGSTLIALVCLPCAGNLARAFAAGSRTPVSLPEAVAVLAGPARTAAAAAARRALELERLSLEDGSPAARTIAAALARLPAVTA